MEYKVKLHPLAEEDLKELYDWCEAREEGLGKRFNEYINKGINKIKNDPERFSKEAAITGKCRLTFFLF